MKLKTKPQTTAIAPPLPKVLRLGLVVEGRIAQERLVRTGEGVTVGRKGATFQVDSAPLSAPLEVFSYQKADGRYSLTVPEWVDGRMNWKGGIRTLSEVRAAGDAVRKGDLWSYPLNDSVRGKLNVGGATLLFQFVQAPPEPLSSVPESLRPHLLDREEPLFMSLNGAFGAMGIAFMTVVNTYDVPPAPPAEPEELVKFFARAPIPKPVAVVDTKVAKAETKTEKVEPKAETPVAKKQESSQPLTRKEALANTALGRRLAAIGTTGLGRAGAGTTAPSFGTLAGDSIVAGTSFMPSTGGSTTGATFAGGTVSSGTIGGGGTVTASVGGAVEVRKIAAPKAVDEPPPSTSPGSDDCIRKARSYSRRVQTCVENMFAANPKAGGAITATWDVVDGVASGVRIMRNDTGDSAFADCVARQIGSWKFGDLNCEIPSYTWRVSAAN